MSYRLISVNGITFNSDGFITAKNIEKMPCIYADLPNGMDGEHYVLEQEPKTGHWIDKFGGVYRCSCCREIISIDTEIEHPNGITYKYCPNCGCRIIGGSE